MQFTEIGKMSGKTLMLLPGTCCDWQTNFETVIPTLSEKYYLICVNYDGFDGKDTIFSDMLTVTKKIEKYILDHHNGRVDMIKRRLTGLLSSSRTYATLKVNGQARGSGYFPGRSN